MTRARLPDRRKQITVDIEWGGQRWATSVGFDATGKVRELFLRGPKVGSDAAALVDDGAVMTSLLLQSGMSVAELARHLSREGVTPDSPAASLLGLAALRAAELEAEERAAAQAPAGGPDAA